VNVHTERRFEISRKADQFIQGLPVKLRRRIKEAVDYLIKGDVHHLDIKPLTPFDMLRVTSSTFYEAVTFD
jgi:hypothetical protein